jgi:hypothetical protein
VGKVVGICAVICLVAGGYLPALWGASTFGFQSLLFGVVGGVVGVWLGVKLTDF